MPDDRRPPHRDDLALNRFWNELVHPTGDPDAAAADLAPDLAETVRRLRALAQSPPPAPARELVRRGLTDRSQTNPNGKETSMLQSATLTIPRSGVDPPRRAQPPAIRPRTAPFGVRPISVPHAATALLLLLTAVLGYIALGPGRHAPDRPTALPAVVDQATPDPATPAPGVAAAETLLSVVLPAEANPHGDRVVGALVDVSFPAGATTTWAAASGACCPGTRIEYVRAGTYTARADGPVQIVSADGDGTPETMPAGTEIVLDAGDSMLYANGTEVVYANPGETPVELLAWSPHDERVGGYEAAPVPDGWVANRGVPLFDQSLPPGPVTLRLRRVELAADATLPPPPGTLQFGVLTSEVAATTGTPEPRDVAFLNDGTIQNFGGRVVVYVLTLEPGDDGAGSPVAGTPAP